MTENVETLVQQMNEDRARRELRSAKGVSFMCGLLIGAAAIAGVFAVLIVPKTKALAASVTELTADHARYGDPKQLQEAIDHAAATLQLPGNWGNCATLSCKASLELVLFESQTAGQQHLLEGERLQSQILQNEISALAEQNWQRTVAQNQGVSDDDAIVGILNLVQPGFGTTLKKLYNAKQGIPAN